MSLLQKTCCLLTAVSLGFTAGCGGVNKKLVGTWKADEVDIRLSNQKLFDSSQPNYNAEKAASRSQRLLGKIGLTITFKEDGVFDRQDMISANQPRKKAGKWSYVRTEDNVYVYRLSIEGKPKEVRIQFESNDAILFDEHLDLKGANKGMFQIKLLRQ